jgi:hypothetical protein
MVKNGKHGKEVGYGIYEVYYTGMGKIENWTEDAVEPFGETVKELKKDLERMLKACDKKVLDYDRLTEQFRNRSSSKKKTRGIK